MLSSILKNKKSAWLGALFAFAIMFGLFSFADASTLTIKNSGQGSGTVKITDGKSSSTLSTNCELKSEGTCTYNPSGTETVFLQVTINSGSSFGGITGCTGGSNLTESYTSGSCGVLMSSDSTVTVAFNSGSSGTTNSSSSSSDTSSSSSSSGSVSKPEKPTVSVSNITSNSATLKATVNNGGDKTASGWIFYIKTGDSSWTQGAGNTINLSGDQTITGNISGLSAGTKYYYQALVKNTSGSTYSDRQSFTTSSDGASSSSSSEGSKVTQYTLKVKLTGAGKVMSSGVANNINCKKSVNSSGKFEISGDCSVKVNKGESLTLTASTPNSNYEFGTWGESCRSAQGATSCTVKMSGNKTVSATFNKKANSNENTVTVSVRKTGNGTGKVISMNSRGGSLAGINCGNDCSENFKQYCEDVEGSRRCGMVYFKATSDKNNTFGGWGGDCITFSGKKDQCYVILDGDKTINANFTGKGNPSESGSLNLNVSVTGSGTVKSDPSSYINCGSKCSVSYNTSSRTITIRATPVSGYKFTGWSGDCSSYGTKSCKIKLNSSHTVSATFESK